MSKQTDFISKHKQDVIEATQGTGLFPSVKMAQMIVESGWGQDYLPRVANNFFGIKKGDSWTGETIEVSTPKDAKKRNLFRKYPTPLDSIKDHTKVVLQKRYIDAGALKAKTPEEQIDAISRGGYAEASAYAATVKSVINSNNLKQLDEEARLLDQQNKKKVKVDLVVSFMIVAGIVASYVLYKKLKRK